MPDWEMTTKTKLKDAWAAGNAAINGWLAVPSPVTAELTARADFDSVTVDLQHGLIDYQAALTMLQAMSASGVTPMAARAVARARAHHEAAGRGRARHRLPDGSTPPRTPRTWCATPATHRAGCAASGRRAPQ